METLRWAKRTDGLQKQSCAPVITAVTAELLKMAGPEACGLRKLRRLWRLRRAAGWQGAALVPLTSSPLAQQEATLRSAQRHWPHAHHPASANTSCCTRVPCECPVPLLSSYLSCSTTYFPLLYINRSVFPFSFAFSLFFCLYFTLLSLTLYLSPPFSLLFFFLFPLYSPSLPFSLSFFPSITLFRSLSISLLPLLLSSHKNVCLCF